MVWPKLPGPAFWTIIVTAVLLTTVTIAGYATDMSWDTISDMVTRSGRLRNTFALFTGFILVCQGYYTVTMYRRWTTRAALYSADPHYFGAVFVTLGYLMSFAGSVGFAIVSTDIAEDEHIIYAGVAFTGIYMYLLAFGCVAWYYHDGNGCECEKGGGALWPNVAVVCLALPAWTTIVFLVDYYSGQAFCFEYAYVWEFIYVISMLGAALGLYIKEPVPLSVGAPLRSHEPVEFGPFTFKCHPELVF